MNSQTIGCLNLNPQKHKLILDIARQLNFPHHFFKMPINELATYLKTKDFLVLIRTKMHVNFNQLNVESFRVSDGTIHIPQPRIINQSPDHGSSSGGGKEQQQQQGSKAISHKHSSLNTQPGGVFKYYTDATGNNHPVVRQILKRRQWLVRVEKIKTNQQFEQVNFFWTQWRRDDITQRLGSQQIYAKIDGNYLLANKASLYQTMSQYYQQIIDKDLDDLMPISYSLITEPDMSRNIKFKEILEKYHYQETKHIWICKPGENANRGRGIRIFTCFKKIQKFLEQKAEENWVIQKYIEKPILVGGVHWYNTPMRKFDIRMFGLAQIVDGIHFRGYFYKEGYIRTSSYPYNLSDLEDRDVHLTNDAVQDRNEEYGKYEQGNKISQKDFANYLKNHMDVNFYKEIYPKIKEAIKNTLHAFWLKLYSRIQEEWQKPNNTDNNESTGKNKKMPLVKFNQFELFGYDFMIDEDSKVYLIEVNTNPCLDTSPCPLLQRLITQILDQTFKVAVDPFLQPTSVFNPQDPKKNENHYANSAEMSVSEYQYEMVYSNYGDILNEPRFFTQQSEKQAMTHEDATDPTEATNDTMNNNENNVQKEIKTGESKI